MEADDSPLMTINPSLPIIVSAWGKARSGKSYLNRMLFDSWPYDRLVIDVNGNALDSSHPSEKITGDLPGKFPPAPAMVGERTKARSLWYRAHPGSATFRDDLDRAVGVALYPQDHRTLLWAGEVGNITPNGRAGPHMQTLLMQYRHYNVTALFDGPRPMNVPTLMLSQSRFVAVFRLPNARDRERIAEEIGFPAKEFHRECFQTWRRGEHDFLLWDAEADTLYRHEPLPSDETAAA